MCQGYKLQKTKGSIYSYIIIKQQIITQRWYNIKNKMDIAKNKKTKDSKTRLRTRKELTRVSQTYINYLDKKQQVEDKYRYNILWDPFLEAS